jgi:hypothetical protein
MHSAKKQKVRLPLCLIKHHPINMYEEVELQPYLILTLDGVSGQISTLVYMYEYTNVLAYDVIIWFERFAQLFRRLNAKYLN